MVIGEKIKDLRLSCNLTQEELADRCELTKGYISQLENDLTSPSIATLIDILSALGTDLKEFFSDSDAEEKVCFGKNEFIEKVTDDYVLNWVVPNAQKNVMEPILLTLNGYGVFETDMPHEGEEFGYVITGTVKVRLGKRSFVVKKGESFYYKADKQHSLENMTDKKATVLWISCPPNF